jgi:hypothetical protein
MPTRRIPNNRIFEFFMMNCLRMNKRNQAAVLLYLVMVKFEAKVPVAVL